MFMKISLYYSGGEDKKQDQAERSARELADSV